MDETQPKLVPEESLVQINQLCRCCLKLRDALLRDFDYKIHAVYRSERFNPRLFCEHYDTLQDLLDGAQASCHLCNIALNCYECVCTMKVAVKLDAGRISHEEASRTNVITTARGTTGVYDIFITLDIGDKQHTNSYLDARIGDTLSFAAKNYSIAQLSNQVAMCEQYNLIKKWLATCTNKTLHPTCNISEKLERPTRLLDLGIYSEEKEKCSTKRRGVRLVEGKTSIGSYAALSYCWGTTNQLKLFRDNQRQFQKHIPFEDLSQVSQDAVTVCRQLSIPFLWVDALCIIQGASIAKTGASKVSDAQDIWKLLLSEYSRTHLSHGEDVLIALAGIASAFEPLLKSKSTYGLWVDYIVQELLWVHSGDCSYEGRETFAKYLPSWSWASAYRHSVYNEGVKPAWLGLEDAYLATLVSWPSDANFNVRFLQGPRDTRLCIKGHLSSYMDPSHNRDRASEESTQREGPHYIPDHNAPKEDLFCLLLRCSTLGNEGLVLKPVDLTVSLYRRVGVIVESVSVSEFSDAPATPGIQRKFHTELWAPLGEEQEIYIV